MAINLRNIGAGYYCATWTDRSTDVAWSLGDLPGLAADIRHTVIKLAVDGAPGVVIDAHIFDRLRGTATRADDTGDDKGGLPG